MRKTALISGITGQDGSFLAELLLEKGYSVHGIIRRSSSFNTGRIDHLYRDLHTVGKPFYLHYGDLLDSTVLRTLIMRTKPDEVYNLGAQSHVKVSFDQPEYTVDVSGLGTLRILDAVRDAQEHLGKQVRFYQASSSEMFGDAREVPQTEDTPFYPRSPYACAKVYSFWQTVNYREAYKIYCANGILFNHESERRGETFVTRKITRAATRIAMGLQQRIYLGNLNARRDWGYAKDYVKAMWLMLQQPEPEDYVIATNKTYSVRSFAELVFRELGITLEWQGDAAGEVGKIAAINPGVYPIKGALEKGAVVLAVDPSYYRPTEVDLLIGNPAKATAKLGWSPETNIDQLTRIMVKHDYQLAENEYQLRK